tara:strand:+ start:198 stop:440 length:243 start_codon:yes stop_codon:yes gene_type:complete
LRSSIQIELLQKLEGEKDALEKDVQKLQTDNEKLERSLDAVSAAFVNMVGLVEQMTTLQQKNQTPNLPFLKESICEAAGM